MNPKCFCTGWSLVAGLAASVLALPSFATSLTLEEALRLAETPRRRCLHRMQRFRLPAVRPFQRVSYLTRSCSLVCRTIPSAAQIAGASMMTS